MTNESSRSVNFALKRAQAQQNAESHIAKLLFAAAKRIVALAQTYRMGLKGFTPTDDFNKRAQQITRETEKEIEEYITAYAKAAAKVLAPDDEDLQATILSQLSSYLKGNIFGKTVGERNSSYLENFAQDIIRMCQAGYAMGYTQDQLLSAVRTGYKTPFSSSVITKAQRKNINIPTPSYGRGIYHSAYQNIIRNATATIALAWGVAERQYGTSNNAIGFRVFRGSSYPCETCQSQVGYVHKMSDDMPPYHCSCKCWTIFVYK